LRVYIDDLCTISLIPWLRAGISLSVGDKVALAADAVYADWPHSTKNAQNDLIDTKMWGIDLEGNKGIVSISRERRMSTRGGAGASLVVCWACGPPSFNYADQVTHCLVSASK
jgi:hypothetical protein